MISTAAKGNNNNTNNNTVLNNKNFISKSNVFSTVVLIKDTENEQTNIANG